MAFEIVHDAVIKSATGFDHHFALGFLKRNFPNIETHFDDKRYLEITLKGIEQGTLAVLKQKIEPVAKAQEKKIKILDGSWRIEPTNS